MNLVHGVFLIQIKETRAAADHMFFMWPYYPDILAQPVPRYTSYPPATAFTADVGAYQQAEALAAVTAGTALSLYVHIPYCQSICWYCGCNTGRAGRSQRLTSYLDALEAEIALVAKLLGGRGKVARLSLGGGSPNALAPVAFVRLIDQLVTNFTMGAVDISVEIDPRTFNRDWAITLAMTGVTRVSFGVQSFDPDIQAAIGRHQPFEQIETCVAALRTRGIGSVNFDLMYGLPLQTTEKLEQTIDLALTLRPDRIALFGYAHLPDMFPRQRRIDGRMLPDSRLRFDMAALGHDRLTMAGYIPVGFDHFALPDDQLAQAAYYGMVRRNFQGFTDDASTVVIGLGASAISLFPDRIVQNEKNTGRYRDQCQMGHLAGSRGVMRDTETQKRARMIEALLCCGATRLDETCLTPENHAKLAHYAARHLIRIDNGFVHLAENAVPYARHVAAALAAGCPV
jgi:oxygen-independent coproporphyrinogen-3 oxidase